MLIIIILKRIQKNTSEFDFQKQEKLTDLHPLNHKLYRLTKYFLKKLKLNK